MNITGCLILHRVSGKAIAHNNSLLGLIRRLATETSQGPPKQILSAIPFQSSRDLRLLASQVSRAGAAAAFEAYHRGHLFFTKPSAGLRKIKEAFLPFWVTAASASVQLKGAQLGFDQWVQRYNPQTRRPEYRLETVWQWVDLQRASWEQRYSPSEEGMQIYASYKYPRSEISRLRPSGAIRIARPFESDMVVSDFDKSTRRVGPFQMKPATALRFVRAHIENEESRRARQFIRSSFRCDRVGQLDMDVRLSSVQTSPVNVPFFVFRSSHFGTKLRTFVSGVVAENVTGTRAVDETRVGLAGGALGALALLASGAASGWAAWDVWVWGFSLPAAVAGLGAHYYTAARNAWNLYWQQSEQAKGYYAVMGVEPGASKQEIQAAYRGLAMKHHPDRVAESEKPAALKRFQEVQEAYSVLRDTAKRKQYDAS